MNRLEAKKAAIMTRKDFGDDDDDAAAAEEADGKQSLGSRVIAAGDGTV